MYEELNSIRSDPFVIGFELRCNGTGATHRNRWKRYLDEIASTKITTQPTNASSADLWNWGSVPLGNIVSKGKLVSTGDDGSNILVYPAFPINTTSIYQISNPMVSKYAASDLQNPDLNLDYWTMAQLTNQSVLY